MKTAPLTSPRSIANLTSWLSGPEAANFFGRTFTLRLAVLSAVVTGAPSLAEVARAHGISRAAASKQGRKARAMLLALATNSCRS